MCGIIYVQRKDGRPAGRAVAKRYRKQRSRGYEGFGYVAVTDNKVVAYERSHDEKEILEKLEKETAPEILFHHRFPTSTPNVAESAHPLFVEHDSFGHSYYIAHNGVIRNTSTLYEKHEKLVIPYSTEMSRELHTRHGKQYVTGKMWNDSESLAVETALALEGKQTSIDSEGAAAVIGFKMKGDRVVERFFYRNSGNPLRRYEDKVLLGIASEGKGTLVASTSIFRVENSQPFTSILPPSVYAQRALGFDTRSRGSIVTTYTSSPTPQGVDFRNIGGVYEDIDSFLARNVHLPPDEDPNPLALMTVDQMWDEYARILTLLGGINRQIEALGDGTDSFSVSSEGVLARARMEQSAQLHEEYIDEILAEIRERAEEDPEIVRLPYEMD